MSYPYIYQVLGQALSFLPSLTESLDEEATKTLENCDRTFSNAKHVLAALSALGGFEELVKPGCHVEVG